LEVFHQFEVGLDSQVPLAQCNEGSDVLDFIGVQVPQLDAIVVQKP
jgi:hypothetical protein